MKRIVLLCLTIFTAFITDAQTIVGEQGAEAIVGGEIPEAEAYPWMSSLMSSGGSPRCGATLIRPDWVLTAAHCYLDSEGKIVINSLTRDIYDLEPYSELIEFDAFISHEGFDHGVVSGPDIALIHLTEPSSITPVQLADFSEAEFFEHGDHAQVIGWGRTLDDEELSDTLMHTDCLFFNDDTCAARYDVFAYSIYEANEGGNICAGYFVDEDPAGAAWGDSGGPLFFEDDLGNYKQVGIVSGGEYSVTTAEFPAVYTLVPVYLDWIESTIAHYELATSLAKENRENVKVVYFADDHLQLTGLNGMDDYQITTYNSRGELLHDNAVVHNGSQFDLVVGDYAAGMYVLRVLNQSTGNVTVQKFIVK